MPQQTFHIYVVVDETTKVYLTYDSWATTCCVRKTIFFYSALYLSMDDCDFDYITKSMEKKLKIG
jgi:hypothetical protein